MLSPVKVLIPHLCDCVKLPVTLIVRLPGSTFVLISGKTPRTLRINTFRESLPLMTFLGFPIMTRALFPTDLLGSHTRPTPHSDLIVIVKTPCMHRSQLSPIFPSVVLHISVTLPNAWLRALILFRLRVNVGTLNMALVTRSLVVSLV